MTASVEVPIGGDIVSFPSWEDAVNHFTKPAEPAADAADQVRADAADEPGADAMGQREIRLYPSLEQLNYERAISGLPAFPNAQAVVDTFDEACEIARRHEAERMRALEREKMV